MRDYIDVTRIREMDDSRRIADLKRLRGGQRKISDVHSPVNLMYGFIDDGSMIGPEELQLTPNDGHTSNFFERP